MVRRDKVRSRMEVDERRTQLLALGLELFSARPYDEVSVDELARAAGISKGLLYHYFPTKRDFYVAALREAARQLLDETYQSDELPPLERLHNGIGAYLGFVAARGAAYSALFRGGIGSDPGVAQILDETRASVLERMLRGMGMAEPPPLLRLALRGWMGSVEVMSLEWVERRDVSGDELRELLAALFLTTLQLALGATLER
jgi:AcrR family transcriptional regulator